MMNDKDNTTINRADKDMTAWGQLPWMSGQRKTDDDDNDEDKYYN